MLICRYNTLSEHFKVLFKLYLTKTLGMTITYNTGSLITQVPSVAPNNSVVMALKCTCIRAGFHGYSDLLETFSLRTMSQL